MKQGYHNLETQDILQTKCDNCRRRFVKNEVKMSVVPLQLAIWRTWMEELDLSQVQQIKMIKNYIESLKDQGLVWYFGRVELIFMEIEMDLRFKKMFHMTWKLRWNPCTFIGKSQICPYTFRKIPLNT